jgi:hypothetical protein
MHLKDWKSGWLAGREERENKSMMAAFSVWIAFSLWVLGGATASVEVSRYRGSRSLAWRTSLLVHNIFIVL